MNIFMIGCINLIKIKKRKLNKIYSYLKKLVVYYKKEKVGGKMKKLKTFFLILCVSFASISMVKADEGIVYSPRTCFGITYGIHNNHWHQAILQNGQYIAQGQPIYTYPCTPSNDPTLKSLTINNNQVQISDKMEFKTYDEQVTIIATPTYQGAKIEYEQNKKLKIGNNNVQIKVTGMAGLSKTYELNIIRQKILSTNNNIKKITIDNKEYKFKNNTINNLFVTSNQKSLNIKVTPEDKNAQITIKNNENLKSGDNKVTIIVEAENGTSQEYYINYHKTMAISDIIGTIIGVLILLSPLIIIIIIISLKNKKKYINNTKHYKKYKL